MSREINDHRVTIEEPANAADRLRCERCGHIGERPSRFEMIACTPDADAEEWLTGPVARVANR